MKNGDQEIKLFIKKGLSLNMEQSLIQQAIESHGMEAFTKAYADQLVNKDMSLEEASATLKYFWPAYARLQQITPPGLWHVWFVLAGRGYGKTRTGSEWIREQVEEHGKKRIALVGETSADCRDTMVEGPAGLLNVCPPWNKPRYEPSKRRLTWPNGAIAITYSGKEPDQLRGPEHDAAWADELAKWQYMEDAWSNLEFGLRGGTDPRVIVTTTPRPLKLIKEIVASENTIVTGGSTYDNQANLPNSFFDMVIQKYDGTRLGQQEIWANILDDNPEALFNRDRIHANRVQQTPEGVKIKVSAIALDPAVTSGDAAADTGIIAGFSGMIKKKVHYFITHDFTCHETPLKWATVAINAYNRLELNMIVGEVNNGGDLIKTVIKQIDNSILFKSVRASKGKAVRAEPISSLYDQNLVHHIGVYPKLEDEMCSWSPDLNERSPDRLDALVWLLTYLSGKGRAKTTVY